MRFKLTDEEQKFQKEVQAFVEEFVEPTAQYRDEHDLYPTEIIKSMAKEGYTALTVPEVYGGKGRSKLEACILMEEVAASCASTAVSLITIFQAQTMLLSFGNETVKNKFLPRFADGLISSYALTESKRGSDIRHLDTKARRSGDKWILNGKKSFITSGSAAEFFIILAETNVGVSVFAVDASTPGVRTETGKLSETFGLRNGPHMDVILEDVCIPDYQLVGIEGHGVKQAVITLNNSRTAAAAISVGIARAAYEFSLARVTNREAFDQKVFNFQGIQWMFTEMLTKISAARLLTLRAAALLDKGEKAISEASQAKLYAGTIATEVCSNAVQACGAFGVTINAPLGRYLRDAKAYEIAGGSNEILRNTIAKEIGKAMHL